MGPGSCGRRAWSGAVTAAPSTSTTGWSNQTRYTVSVVSGSAGWNVNDVTPARRPVGTSRPATAGSTRNAAAALVMSTGASNATRNPESSARRAPAVVVAAIVPATASRVTNTDRAGLASG